MTTIDRRTLLYVLVAAAFVAGAAGGLFTVALLTDAESVEVTFKAATVAAGAPLAAWRPYVAGRQRGE